MNGRTKRFSFVSIVVALAALQAIYAFLNYRSVVYADQWDLVPILDAFLNRGDWLTAVFTHHGDHFHTSAYLIMLPLAYLSDWNLSWELATILVVNLLSYLMLYKSVFSVVVERKGSYWLIVSLLISSIYFSTAHGGNLLWTWQLAVYLVTFGLSLTIFGFSSVKNFNLGFVVAIFGAVIASFSFSCGFAIWPAGVFLITTKHDTSWLTRVIFLAIWCAVGFIIVAFFLNSVDGTFSQELDLSASKSVIFLLYFLGTPLAYFSRELSLVVSALGLCSFIYLALRLAFESKQSDRTLLYAVIAMGSFAVVSGLLISLGRLELGFSQARSFRYIIFSQFFWIALFMLIWIRRAVFTKQTVVSRCITSCLVFCMALVIFNAQKIGRTASATAQEHQIYWEEFSGAGEQHELRQIMLKNLNYPDDETSIKYAKMLEDNGLNLYRSD